VISLLLLPLALLGFFGLLSLLLSRLPRASHLVGWAGACAASCLGLLLAILALARGENGALSLPWNQVIGSSFAVGFDQLSGFFLLSVYGLSALCALFGAGYMARSEKGRGAHWLFYGLLVASMALAVLARNAVLFLMAWELMAISSWLLVSYEHEKEEVRQAGITYLVATQIGTAFLLVMFLVLGRFGAAGLGPGPGASLDFARFVGIGGPAAAAVFILALVGFGTKAGIVPLHVWLPEAHPAAPSHVSALMSGVMIKTGIYGLLRVLSFLGFPPAWWGWTLVAVGAVSGVMGVLYALAQHDIKRLLAYHSVENIGIICLGMGIGLLGTAYSAPALAALGYAGGLLHVINHAFFKGLLFLGAGAASHAAGTREIDRLGGLLKCMPVTGTTFLVGSTAICGLPPLNGFVSEFLVFSGAYRAIAAGPVAMAAVSGAVVAALALIGGLAAACFAKAFGIVFLGEPRTPAAAAAREVRPTMTAAMVALAAGCAVVGILGARAVWAIAPLAAAAAGIASNAAAAALAPAASSLRVVTIVAGVLAGIIALLILLRALLQSRRAVDRAGTWDCGYAKPGARMQYTASSFAQPLTGTFGALLGTRTNWTPPSSAFPSHAEYSTHTPDAFTHGVYRPAFNGIGSLLSRFAWLQHGRLQLYVLYIGAALLALLVWRLS
jgi:hydrogenase-4 component B